MSFRDGLLAIPYYKKDVSRVFLAIYNLDGLDYTKSHTSPLYMFGGYYENFYNEGNKVVLNILDNNSSSEYPQARIL